MRRPIVLACLIGVSSLCVASNPTQEDELLAFQIRMTLIEVYQKAIVAPVILPSCETRSAQAQKILDDESYVARWVLFNTHSIMQAWPLDAESGKVMVHDLQTMLNQARERSQMDLMRQEMSQMGPQRIAELCGEMEVLAERIAHAQVSFEQRASYEGAKEHQ